MKKWTLSLTLILAILVLAACGKEAGSTTGAAGSDAAPAATVKVAQTTGDVEVPKNPQRVVVFDMGILDTMDQLGIKPVAVPQDNLPPYLEKYKSSDYINAGGLKEPDFEKVSEAAPDLIIISGRQADSYEEFSKIAKTINLSVDTNDYMKSFTQNMNIIGEIFGKQDEINEALTAINNEVTATQEKVKKANHNALIVLANEGSLSAYGAGSRFGLIHDVLGFKAADPNIEVSTHGQSVSPEYVAEKNPDYLFVVDRGSAIGEDSSGKATVENALVKNTNAYKNGHIVYLNPYYWYLSGGGLQSVSEMVKEVGDAVQG
ncbi:siderophore ABC transporter substrate-binding protein [Paenibacillus bovis]|uniref:ABC transporter n=1 Tax=Paenibacillus bovis TaxID=1616788 RepID=A0A172ZMG4_9BACL|nr:siderophore ABC transporter substrate-binding protein [Paenibacillus bovis]ANF98320.1 ABC transporter [Paenibacillus bovis]